MNHYFIPAFISLFALAACGGSSEAGGPSFASLTARGEALLERYKDASITEEENLPTASARYTGVAAFGGAESALDPDEAEVLSEIGLSANFATDRISGSMTNFRDYENQAIGGTVNIIEAPIVASGFSSTLDGLLSFEGRSHGVSGTIGGVFIGPAAEGVIGSISADVADYGEFDGYYIAER